MAERITDMFTSAIERDVYFKVRDDVGETLGRILDNFSTDRFTKSEVILPAVFALAWVLRAVLLTIKKQVGDAVYAEVLFKAMMLASSTDPGDNDGRS